MSRLFIFLFLFYLVGVLHLKAQNAELPVVNALSKSAIAQDLDTLLTAIEETHPVPFRIIPKDRWVSLKESMIEHAPLSYSVFYAQVLRFIALAKDGHMDAYPKAPSGVRHALPAKFIVFPNGLYVMATSHDLKYLLGKKILRIEDMPIQKS